MLSWTTTEVICAAVDGISAAIERRVGLTAIAEIVVD